MRPVTGMVGPEWAGMGRDGVALQQQGAYQCLKGDTYT